MQFPDISFTSKDETLLIPHQVSTRPLNATLSFISLKQQC